MTASSNPAAMSVAADNNSGVVTAVDLEQRAISSWFEGGSGIETISYY